MDREIVRLRAYKALSDHGLLEQHWTFKFGKGGERTIGRCYGLRKMITISGRYVDVNDWEHIQDVLMHEIAHALVGTHHGHDDVWKAKARELGATPSPYKNDAVSVASRWVGICPEHGKVAGRARLPQGRRYRCNDCTSLISWHLRTSPVYVSLEKELKS